jgi:hypothetical protein
LSSTFARRASLWIGLNAARATDPTGRRGEPLAGAGLRERQYVSDVARLHSVERGHDVLDLLHESTPLAPRGAGFQVFLVKLAQEL